MNTLKNDTVLITCDHLLGRFSSIHIVEYFLDLFPDATLRTCATTPKYPGNVLGKRGFRKIEAGPLTRLRPSLKYFYGLSFLAPEVRSSEEEKHVNNGINFIISDGVGHCLSKSGRKKVTYLYSLNSIKGKGPFRNYLQKKSIDMLNTSDLVITSSLRLK